MSRKLKSAPATGPKVGVVRGEVVIRTLATVKPNPWNPNRMTTHQMDSLVHGLRTDGWLASQALLIWGVDEGGTERNLIIDGEHRYKGAVTIGMTEGPMVFLNGLTEAQAKALTIKMNQKRGEFDDAALETLVRELVGEMGTLEGVDLEFGIDPKELVKMAGSAVDEAMGVPPPAPPPPASGLVGSLPGLKVPMVFYIPNEQLDYFKAPFFNAERPTELRLDVLRGMIQMWMDRGAHT